MSEIKISFARLVGFVATTIFFIGMLLQCATAKAAPAVSAGSPVFASVDMTKVIASYSKRASAEAAFQQQQQQYQDVFKTQTANAMLSEEDQQKLGQLLLLGDTATADQKQEIADLETQAGKASNDLATLQQKANATDADKIALQQLTQQQQAGQTALQDVADSYKDQLDQQNQKLSEQIAGDIRGAVAAIAKQQGITIVFDSSVAIYAANDVTDAVITKLGANK